MSSEISSPDESTANCIGKFIDVNILPPITESKTINKEIIVHVLKVHTSDEGIRLYTASCEVFWKRNIEQFSQSHNFRQKTWNPHEQKIQIKNFCAVHHLRGNFSLLASQAWGETDGRSLRFIRKKNIILRPKLKYLYARFREQKWESKNLHSLKFLWKPSSTMFSNETPAYKALEITLKEKHERKSITFYKKGSGKKLWWSMARIVSFDVCHWVHFKT